MFPKMKQKVAVVALTAGLSMGYTPQSHALLPITDYANLAENLAGNIQAMYNWAEEKSMMMLEMELESVLQSLNIDNMNNAMANQIAREDMAKQSLQNKDMMEKSAPDKDACGTIGIQILANDILCVTADETQQKTKESEEKHGNYSDTPADHKRNVNNIVKEVVEDCEALQDGSSPLNEENPLKTSLCTKAGLLVGSAGNTLDPTQNEAADRAIELIVGVTPSFKRSSQLSPGTPSYNKARTQEMRLEAYRSLANTSMHEVKSITKYSGSKADPGPSQMDLLAKFDDDRFGNVTWMATLQNASAAQKNSVYPSEVLRKIAVMESFLVHMEVLKFKQQLRMESLQAAMLALQIDPPR